MKSFLQTFYLHAPDDLLIERKENTEPIILGRDERFNKARQKLGLEVDSLLSCFAKFGQEVRPDGPGQAWETLRGEFEARRSAFKAQSPKIKVPVEGFSKMKLELIKREMETDLAFLPR
jgi:hypothetical protein